MDKVPTSSLNTVMRRYQRDSLLVSAVLRMIKQLESSATHRIILEQGSSGQMHQHPRVSVWLCMIGSVFDETATTTVATHRLSVAHHVVSQKGLEILTDTSWLIDDDVLSHTSLSHSSSGAATLHRQHTWRWLCLS